ncbi:MAG TPA: hypothetical protein VKY85_26205 [Candidatus Angelobacter sp.]|nr:hypothetical protein [Candidatus Angelobacter sp.]
MKKQLKKIKLNQETLRNLTTSELSKVGGGFSQHCPTGLTCPECAPPLRAK